MNFTDQYKNLVVYGTAIVVIACVLLFTYKLVRRTGKFDDESVKPGQFYKLVLHDEDPFKDDVSIFFQILDKKDGYVQFLNLESGDTNSERISFFLNQVTLTDEAELQTSPNVQKEEKR